MIYDWDKISKNCSFCLHFAPWKRGPECGIGIDLSGLWDECDCVRFEEDEERYHGFTDPFEFPAAIWDLKGTSPDRWSYPVDGNFMVLE